MDYQYTVFAQHLNAKPGIGVQYEAVFKTVEEQQAYVAELRAMRLPVCQGSGVGNKPYGKTSFEFSMDRFWGLQEGWIRDHEFSGRD